MNHKEDDTQEAFFDWCQGKSFNGKPLSKVCYAIPNGGNRNAREAARMKRQGVLAGVADVFLSVFAGGYYGLYIEFKHGDNAMSREQVEFKETVVKNGYQHVVCFSVEDAIDEVQLYFSGSRKVPFSGIDEVDGDCKYLASCRRMSARFKTRRGAVGWLRRRGFGENGERI